MIPSETLAAVLTEPGGRVQIASMPVREPGESEVLVRMEACGLCHSDLFVAGLAKLPLAPVILGHEGIGRIEAVGPSVEGFSRGDRVGLTFLGSTCGSCELCATGRERFCARQMNLGYTLPGVLAQYATVPAAKLVRVPDGLSAAIAAPLCCAGWTAYGALRETGLASGQMVALFGMGGLGHLAVQYARQLGLRVAAMDVSPEKLDLARELGAETVLTSENAGRALQKQHGGADAAIVLTKSVAAIEQAFRSLKRTGTLVLVGLATDQFTLPLVDTVLKGIHIRGSYLGTSSDLQEVFRLAEQEIVQPQVETHALADTPELLERMSRGMILGRAVVTF